MRDLGLKALRLSACLSRDCCPQSLLLLEAIGGPCPGLERLSMCSLLLMNSSYLQNELHVLGVKALS